MSRFLTLLLSALLTAACGREADSTPAPADPVVIPDEPAEVGRELQWTAPPAPEIEEGSEWARPNRTAAGDDFIAVLDRGLPRVHLFTLSGERESSFGEGGEGPGELPEPRWLGVTMILRSRAAARRCTGSSWGKEGWASLAERMSRSRPSPTSEQECGTSSSIWKRASFKRPVYA